MSEPSSQLILVRLHEVVLKGANRGWFEKLVLQNSLALLKRAHPHLQGPKILGQRSHGRILIHAPWDGQTRLALSRSFGISSFSPIRTSPTSKEAVNEALRQEYAAFVKAFGRPKTFRVRSRRSDKVFPETSVELDRAFGGTVLEVDPELRVDLKKADLTLGIELRTGESYLYSQRFAGPGGLPIGSNGPVLCMLSGGLDSPVAALQILKRGSHANFLHFSGEPFVGPEALQKVEDLVRILHAYQPTPGHLVVIPFGKIQEQVALQAHPRFRTLLYRRLMFRIASEAAPTLRAKALVTGEALGQVASQTLENLASIDRCSSLPVLRPLVGMDKQEIVELARKWGTFETSILPGQDCCTLFADRHPALAARESTLREIEAKLDINALVGQALASALPNPLPKLSSWGNATAEGPRA